MGLMGENGAGKSTMMKCLFGTYQKDEGTIILDGREVNFSGTEGCTGKWRSDGTPGIEPVSWKEVLSTICSLVDIRKILSELLMKQE